MPLKNANILAQKATPSKLPTPDELGDIPENSEPPAETPETGLTPLVTVADQGEQTEVPVGGEAVGTPAQPTVLEAEASAEQSEAPPKPEVQPTKERKRAKP